jgi:hypothetical protein
MTSGDWVNYVSQPRINPVSAHSKAAEPDF